MRYDVRVVHEVDSCDILRIVVETVAILGAQINEHRINQQEGAIGTELRSRRNNSLRGGTDADKLVRLARVAEHDRALGDVLSVFFGQVIGGELSSGEDRVEARQASSSDRRSRGRDQALGGTVAHVQADLNVAAEHEERNLRHSEAEFVNRGDHLCGGSRTTTGAQRQSAETGSWGNIRLIDYTKELRITVGH